MISWPWKKPKLYRHGDLLIKQIDHIPLIAKPLSTSIIAEGEITGHNHKLYGSHQVGGSWYGLEIPPNTWRISQNEKT